jgi:hypothetical protein
MAWQEKRGDIHRNRTAQFGESAENRQLQVRGQRGLQRAARRGFAGLAFGERFFEASADQHAGRCRDNA